MDLLLILKKINLTSILKSTITNLINKKYNNQKTISESINNKLITLKESWMDGKERPNKLMLRLKEFKENCSNMLRKKIVYPTCWKLKTTSMKLWEDHWQTMKLKQEKYNICKPHVNNLTYFFILFQNHIMGLVGDIQVCERNSKTLEQELEKERQFTNEFAFKIIILSA